MFKSIFIESSSSRPRAPRRWAKSQLLEAIQQAVLRRRSTGYAELENTAAANGGSGFRVPTFRDENHVVELTRETGPRSKLIKALRIPIVFWLDEIVLRMRLRWLG